VHFTVQGTHRGEFMGMPATGREIMIQGVDIFRLVGDKIAEQWVVMDVLGLMQQLGAVPIPT
jgi:predicted ester cyclase